MKAAERAVLLASLVLVELVRKDSMTEAQLKALQASVVAACAECGAVPQIVYEAAARTLDEGTRLKLANASFGAPLSLVQ
jgi:hypothetical protein